MIVSDADAFYDKTKKQGAEILIEIKDEEYGSRSFTCRDPGKYIWTLGSYDP